MCRYLYSIAIYGRACENWPSEHAKNCHFFVFALSLFTLPPQNLMGFDEFSSAAYGKGYYILNGRH